MKKRTIILIAFILISLFGCIETKVYLEKPAPPDEAEQVYGAINPTTIPAGITWGTFRGYINENFEEIDLAIDTLDDGLAAAVSDITALETAIQLRLLKSDSIIFATQHDLATGLARKQDTISLKTINGESIEGTGDITITGGSGGAWGDITGTLTNQVDLANALASKQDTASNAPEQVTTEAISTGTFYPLMGNSTSGSVDIKTSATLLYDAFLNQLISGSFATGTATSGMWVTPIGLLASGSDTNIDVTIYPKGTGVVKFADTDTLATLANLSEGLTAKQDTSARMRAIVELADGSGQLTNDGSGNLSWTATGGTGTVTSVGISVPTGLAVNNSPITTSGEIGLSFASGYSIPTTAKQTEWDNAYTNRITSVSGTAPLNLSLSSNAITGTIDQASTSSAGTMSAADKLKLDHMKDSIEKALDDAFGTGAELTNLVVMREDSLGATNEVYVPVYAFIQAMQNQVHRADSNSTAPGNYVPYQRMVDYVAANSGSAEGITLNSGTLTLTGDEGTADDVTFYTNGDGQYNLPAGGGNLTIMSEVQGWINDSADVIRGLLLVSNWDAAYSDRLKWDGGSTGLTASTGRTSLGGTTIGQAMFTLTNPSAITFPRFNADNTVSALSAANFKTALSLAASDVGLGNVTNESKATMFTSPTLTGTATLPSTTSIGNVSSTEIGYVDGVTSAIQTQLNAKAPLSLTLNAQVGTSYTLVLSDAYKIVTMTNANANTLTVPLNSSQAFPTGTQITIVQGGAGATTIAASGGVTINSADGADILRVQYSACTLIKIDTDTWLLIGDIE